MAKYGTDSSPIELVDIPKQPSVTVASRNTVNSDDAIISGSSNSPQMPMHTIHYPLN